MNFGMLAYQETDNNEQEYSRPKAIASGLRIISWQRYGLNLTQFKKRTCINKIIFKKICLCVNSSTSCHLQNGLGANLGLAFDSTISLLVSTSFPQICVSSSAAQSYKRLFVTLGSCRGRSFYENSVGNICPLVPSWIHTVHHCPTEGIHPAAQACSVARLLLQS